MGMDKEKENNNGIDLNKSFTNSEREFQEGKRSPEYIFLPGTPKIIQWLIRYSGGLIKNKKQATYLLLGLVIFVIIISLFLIFGRQERKGIFTPFPAEGPAEEIFPPAEF
jgi:hypothetical protein